LVLVIVGGAELFTGNALIVMAWASRRISLLALLRNWTLVYAGNLAGALAMVALVYLSGSLELDGGAVAQTAAAIAKAKLSLPVAEAFFRGVLCNALVCLAVWLCFSARDVAGKILALVGPICAFVALGFEHSVANMYLIPIGMLAGAGFDPGGFARNLFWVTLGNIAGGAGGVAMAYWTIYLRPKLSRAPVAGLQIIDSGAEWAQATGTAAGAAAGPARRPGEIAGLEVIPGQNVEAARPEGQSLAKPDDP
jgi:formate transporter